MLVTRKENGTRSQIKKLILRRGLDYRLPSALESSPPPSKAIDFEKLDVVCGLDTISLNIKFTDRNQVVERLRLLENCPYINPSAGEIVKVTFKSGRNNNNWYLSTGERLWIRDDQHLFISLKGDIKGGEGYLTIQFEARWPLTTKNTQPIRFKDLLQYYAEYLVPHIEAVLDLPGLFSTIQPVVGRFDIAFDVTYAHPLHLLHSTRGMRFDGRIAKDRRDSDRHTKASTKSHSTEFTRYSKGKKKSRSIGVRFELRRKRQRNVKGALLGGSRNAGIEDLCNHDILRNFLEASFKKYRIYPSTPIIPLQVAIERERHASVRRKLENCLKVNKTKGASRNHRELLKHNIVIGSFDKESFELINVYESFIKAFEAAC